MCKGGVARGAAGVSSLSGRDCCSERIQRSHDQDSSVKGRTIGNDRSQRKRRHRRYATAVRDNQTCPTEPQGRALYKQMLGFIMRAGNEPRRVQ